MLNTLAASASVRRATEASVALFIICSVCARQREDQSLPSLSPCGECTIRGVDLYSHNAQQVKRSSHLESRPVSGLRVLPLQLLGIRARGIGLLLELQRIVNDEDVWEAFAFAYVEGEEVGGAICHVETVVMVGADVSERRCVKIINVRARRGASLLESFEVRALCWSVCSCCTRRLRVWNRVWLAETREGEVAETCSCRCFFTPPFR